MSHEQPNFKVNENPSIGAPPLRVVSTDPYRFVADQIQQQSEYIRKIIRDQSEQLKALSDIYSTEINTSVVLNDINARLDALEIITTQLNVIHIRVMSPWHQRFYVWLRSFFV